MSAYYPDDQVVEMVGEPTVYRRQSVRDTWLDFRFCATCGCHVWWRAEFYSDGIGIAGSLLKDGFAFTPDYHVWSQNLPGFVHWSDAEMPVYDQGSSGRRVNG